MIQAVCVRVIPEAAEKSCKKQHAQCAIIRNEYSMGFAPMMMGDRESQSKSGPAGAASRLGDGIILKGWD